MTASSRSFDPRLTGSLEADCGDGDGYPLASGSSQRAAREAVRHPATATPHESSLPAADDRERRLIEAARQQDHDAYRQLMEQHQEKIFRFCLSCLNGRDEDAHEACQDTFVKAYLALPGFRLRSNARFSSWLFRIALNLCRDQLRSADHRRQQITDPVDETQGGAPDSATNRPFLPPCPLNSPDETLSLREDLEKLQRGIDALPRRLREALLLATLDDLGYRQCAEILRCSERAVEGRIRRARRQLTSWWNQQA